MNEIDNELELKKFNKWRKDIGKELPDLSKRVFALRKIGYVGCGFHWSLEKDLGYVIHMANDFDPKMPEHSFSDMANRIVAKVRYEHFIKRLEEIERGGYFEMKIKSRI